MNHTDRKPQRGRPVDHPKIMVDQTGKIYNSYEDVAKAIGGHRGNVLQCLRGLRQRCNGYTFSYVYD
jgi:hypothetical protein